MDNSQIMISDNHIYNYDSTHWKSFDEGNAIEWIMTNELGGYSSGSLIGSKNRIHQGYLAAVLDSSVEKVVILETVTEWIRLGLEEYDFETSRHRVDGKTIYKEGQKYLKKIECDGTICFQYEIPGLSYTKSIGLIQNENKVAIAYCFENKSDEVANVVLTPMFNYREQNAFSTQDDLQFDLIITGDTLSLVPKSNPKVRIDFSTSEGEYYELRNKYDDNYELNSEDKSETERSICHYMPFEIGIEVTPGESKNFSIVCKLHEDDCLEGIELLENATDEFVGPKSALKLLKQVKESY